MSCGCWSPSQGLVQNPRAPGLSDGLLWNITPSGPSRLPSEERAPHWDHCGNLRVGTPGWWAGGEGPGLPRLRELMGGSCEDPSLGTCSGGGGLVSSHPTECCYSQWVTSGHPLGLG